MNVYQAIFKVDVDALSSARKVYIQRFGEASFEEIIRPYLSRETPGFLFCAPASPELYFYIDRVSRIASEKSRSEYEPPPEFMAVFIDDTPTGTCEKCGIVVNAKTLSDATSIGMDQIVCLRCYSEQTRSIVAGYIAQMQGSHIKKGYQ